GILVYQTGRAQQGNTIIAWLDRSGKTEPLHNQPGFYMTPRLSPDGKRLAFTISAGGSSDLWVKDLDRDTPMRLTFLKEFNDWPVWTPDGKAIVFRSTNRDAPGLYWIRADGAGDAQRLTDGKVPEFPYSFSPDGKRLAFAQNGKTGEPDILTAPLEGDP